MPAILRSVVMVCSSCACRGESYVDLMPSFATASTYALSRLQMNEPAFVRDRQRLGAADGVQLLQDRLHMALRGALRDIKFARDILVAASLRQELQYVRLARGQAGFCRATDRLGGDRRGGVRLIATDRANGREDLLPWRVFQQVTLGAQGQTTEDVFVVVVGGHDEQTRIRINGEQPFDHRETVASGHAQVEDHHVRNMLFVQGNRRLAIAGLGHDLHIGLLIDDRDQAFPHHGMIVRENNASLECRCRHVDLSLGTRTVTLVPSPMRLPMYQSAPIVRARSRMLSSPNPCCASIANDCCMPTPSSST